MPVFLFSVLFMAIWFIFTVSAAGGRRHKRIVLSPGVPSLICAAAALLDETITLAPVFYSGYYLHVYSVAHARLHFCRAHYRTTSITHNVLSPASCAAATGLACVPPFCGIIRLETQCAYRYGQLPVLFHRIYSHVGRKSGLEFQIGIRRIHHRFVRHHVRGLS